MKKVLVISWSLFIASLFWLCDLAVFMPSLYAYKTQVDAMEMILLMSLASGLTALIIDYDDKKEKNEKNNGDCA